MIRDHVRHIHSELSAQSLVVRLGVIVASVLFLLLAKTASDWLAATATFDWLALPVLVVAHVPLVVIGITLWTVGCDVCS